MAWIHFLSLFLVVSSQENVWDSLNFVSQIIMDINDSEYLSFEKEVSQFVKLQVEKKKKAFTLHCILYILLFFLHLMYFGKREF